MSLWLRLPLEEVVGVGLSKMGQRDAAWSKERAKIWIRFIDHIIPQIFVSNSFLLDDIMVVNSKWTINDYSTAHA